MLVSTFAALCIYVYISCEWVFKVHMKINYMLLFGVIGFNYYFRQYRDVKKNLYMRCCNWIRKFFRRQKVNFSQSIFLRNISFPLENVKLKISVRVKIWIQRLSYHFILIFFLPSAINTLEFLFSWKSLKSKWVRTLCVSLWGSI